MPTGVYIRKYPIKGHPQTEETKRKIGLANKGKTLSKETKEKLSKINKGKKHSEETKSKLRGIIRSAEWIDKLKKAWIIRKEKGFGHPTLGRKFTEKHKERLGESQKLRFKSSSVWNKDKKTGFNSKTPLLTRQRKSESQRGQKSHFWKGGITPENRLIRTRAEIRLWRETVFTRDNWTCQKSKIKGGRLCAHHIQNFADYPELRFIIDNGITLSREAHKLFHHIYGVKKNTKEQMNEFLNARIASNHY